MKLLFDENLSARLPLVLADLYPGSAHVHEVGLGSSDDGEVWDYAKVYGFAIATKDADFAERSVLEERPPKILWLRMGNCATTEIERLLRVHAGAVRVFLESDQETCLVLRRL